jgi:hypothetical protein
MKRLVVLGVAMTVVGVMAGVRQADAQTKEARGTVTRIADATLSINAGTQELTFIVDSQTHLEVRSAAKKVQENQPGSPSPRVKDFFEVGQAVVIRYREESGRNHALDISRVGSAGSGGGSVSDPKKIAEGTVKSVTPSQLTIRHWRSRAHAQNQSGYRCPGARRVESDEGGRGKYADYHLCARG